MKSWRSKPNRRLYRTAIKVNEMGKLCQAMYEDGLIAMITPKGIRWYINGYSIQSTSIYEAWGLSKSQYARLKDCIYETDFFDKVVNKGE